MDRQVTIRKRKFDGRVVWDWDGDLVDGNDDWLVVYHEVGRHILHRHGREPSVPAPYALSYVSTIEPLAIAVYFDERGELTGYKCDAGLPGRMTGRVIEFVDLDVDVVVTRGLSYATKDEEEFAEHCLTMGYTEAAQAAAWEGIRRAIARVERRGMPFDGSAERMLERVRMAAEGEGSDALVRGRKFSVNVGGGVERMSGDLWRRRVP